MKRWLYERFLPMWAKQTLLMEYRQVCRENQALRQRVREQQAYIHGLHKGLRGRSGKNGELRIES